MASVDAPSSGNVLLRRAQYRLADDPAARAAVARCTVAGKVQNDRHLLVQAGREIGRRGLKLAHGGDGGSNLRVPRRDECRGGLKRC
jgi:CRISPR-associated protein Cas1